MTTQRLVILGDAHIHDAEREIWETEIIPDINRLRPDFVFALGDLTNGASQDVREAVEILSGLDAPWSSIIGNHDLQSPDFDTDEAAVGMMLSALQRETPQFSVETDHFAVIGLSNTFWRRNCVNKNEIVIDDAQLDWWRGELLRLGDKPAILLGHAPVFGGGLMVMPELHVRVGNACVNQNHHPGRIPQIIWEHANILFWFSGHTHLGQHYRDAIANRLGVHHVHVGTASLRASRDACRHSRLLEIGPDSLCLRTFDHDLRALDPTGDHPIAHSLASLVERRKRMLGKRFVPRNSVTMEHVAPLGCQRLLFLSDAHSVAPLAPIQQRIAAWCARQIRALTPHRVILGGDITHRPIPAQAEAFLSRLGAVGVPMDYLPGNNEGPAFPGVLRGCVSLGENVFLLATSNGDEAAESVGDLLRQLPPSQPCLVFAHFPPHLAGEALLRGLEERGSPIHWICGHRHEALEDIRGGLRVTVCAGLDPIKVRRSGPEVLACDWDGRNAAIQRIPVPQKFLCPRGTFLRRVGVAFRGSAEDLLTTAIERRIPAIQFHYQRSRDRATSREKNLAKDYRAAIPDAFLSLHLPNFPHPAEGICLEDLLPWLCWAEDMGLNDLTVHPPKVEAGHLFDEEGRMQASDWTERCLRAYTDLAQRALSMGAQLSIENVYNKEVNPPGQERLGSQPWHLLRLVEAIRERVKASAEQREKIGIIFDAGHAFADVQISKSHGLADWLAQVAPYLQLSHIHQVLPRTEGRGTRNHNPIRDIHGPLINYNGLLAAFEDIPQPFPLLIEVRDREEALESWRLLDASSRCE